MESWGRKRRNVDTLEKSEEDMTLSQEILVLDFGDDETKFSNRKTASLPANFPNNSKIVLFFKYPNNVNKRI